MHSTEPQFTFADRSPPVDSMRQDVLRGLSQPQKQISSKYFYDERGSALFERICELEEYYLTRTELAIMSESIDEMVAQLGAGCLLIEYGSGSSTKTKLLLDHLPAPAGYVPIDISREHLKLVAAEMLALFPDVEVLPVCADFTDPIELPNPERPVRRRVVYFPGSTLGNFGPAPAHRLLLGIAQLVGQGGGLLIGLDLKKDPRVLQAAYSDSEGVTREFNLNLLARLNRELGADFDLKQFDHRAVYDAEQGRMESHLVSRRDQAVRIDGHKFFFRQDETIHTESSYKYDRGQFADMAAKAGLTVEQVWTDANDLFSVQYLTAAT